MESLDTVRESIRAKRKSLGIHQAELARLAQVSLPTLKALEQGRARELGFAKVSRILAALGLELRLQEANQAINQGRPTLDQLRDEVEDD